MKNNFLIKILYGLKVFFRAIDERTNNFETGYSSKDYGHVLFIENGIANIAVIGMMIVCLFYKDSFNLMFGNGFIKGRGISWFLIGMKELYAATPSKWLLYACFFIMFHACIVFFSRLFFDLARSGEGIVALIICYAFAHFVVGKLLMEKLEAKWAGYAVLIVIFLHLKTQFTYLIAFLAALTEEQYEKHYIDIYLSNDDRYDYYLKYNSKRASEVMTDTKYAQMCNEMCQKFARFSNEIYKKIDGYEETEEIKSLKNCLYELAKKEKEIAKEQSPSKRYKEYIRLNDKALKIKNEAENYMDSIDRKRKEERERKERERQREKERLEDERIKREEERRREERRREQEQKRRSEERQRNYNTTSRASAQTMDFFKDCNDKKSIEKRYRDLTKVYHPDQGNGSEEVFKVIQNQYDKLKERF